MSAPPPPARGGMSLYANLLESNSDSSASISRDPVLFKQQETNIDSASKKTIDPALRFQPIRRPQVRQTNKPKPSFPKVPSAPTATTNTTSGGNGAPSNLPAAATQPRSKLADWTATEDDEYLYSGGGEKRQRGGRRKKRKKADDVPLETDWDELYDPARPTNVEEYLRSEERIREVREWKAVLYAHRRQRASSYDSEMGSGREEEDRRPMNQFAPPASLSFAPPPISPPRAPPAAAADAATGDDAYARRLALSGMAPAPPPAPASPSPPPPPPPPPPPTLTTDTNSATISRAPVRYEPPPPPPPNDAMDLDDDNDDSDDEEVNYAAIPTLPPPAAAAAAPSDTTEAPTTNRPGQAGFAQRLMAKYGWQKGTGLGADAGGITSALRVQIEKRRRRPDSEGGGFAEPGGRGKIISSSSSSSKQLPNNNDGKFGKMSNVIVLRNMLEGMPDLEAEVEAGLGQEIGEECGDQYGRVERVYIETRGRLVFIKFTDQVSALRAVNALEGRIFNGNVIAPSFYELDKFENGEYS
ncbi:hypothetical protein QBC47DRAFT_451404 [Echria macrotheca]|uniref:G-patch domain-containing protein n=1 Tax=Echria macrotheca TaxID=438768 RepID=A0AAJ0BEK9_9PEZI|nr:hypothetical protein QBC47DRAFT_451404 [Echria macrotheca]